MTEKVHEYGYLDLTDGVVWPDRDGELYSRKQRRFVPARSDLEADMELLWEEATRRGKALVRREVSDYEVVPEPRPPLPAEMAAVVQHQNNGGKKSVYVRADETYTPWLKVSGPGTNWISDESLSRFDFTVIFPGIGVGNGD